MQLLLILTALYPLLIFGHRPSPKLVMNQNNDPSDFFQTKYACNCISCFVVLYTDSQCLKASIRRAGENIWTILKKCVLTEMRQLILWDVNNYVINLLLQKWVFCPFILLAGLCHPKAASSSMSSPL